MTLTNTFFSDRARIFSELRSADGSSSGSCAGSRGSGADVGLASHERGVAEDGGDEVQEGGGAAAQERKEDQRQVRQSLVQG